MDYSRIIADHAARRLQTLGEDALTMAALLGARTSSPSAAGEPKSSLVSTDEIGIWCKRSDANGTRYVRRSNAGSAGRLAFERWADTEVIPPKSTRRRVVLLGESVARGYFYDPIHTPAAVLQTLLARQLPEGAEVIDLAANDLSSAELLDLLTKVPALAPDALVIFAGNNWASAPLRLAAEDIDTRQSAAAALRTGGVPALKQLLEERLLRRIAEQLRMLPRLLQAMNIPAVVVVPEFNLTGWRSDPSNNAPWLTGAANRNWWEHHRRAQQALEEHDAAGAISHAEAMLALDAGVTHNALEIIGAALADSGRRSQARSVLERARDARIWDVANLSPRSYTSIQEGLRRAASERVRIVDVPAILSRMSASGLPDSSVFMDYCHLSGPAIAVTMASVAQALIPDIKLGRLEELREDSALLPAPEVESTAHLLAAIHNAHWGQSRDTVRHHLHIAAQSPGTRAMLRVVLDLQGRRVPAWMTQAAASILQEPRPQLSRYFLAYGQGRCFDEHLLDLIAETLERCSDDNASSRLAQRRRAEWSAQSQTGRIDLLAEEWTHLADHSRPKHEQVRGTAGQTRGWHRSYTPISRFPVISAAAGATGMNIQMTCRRPPFFSPDGECRIRLNGEPIGTLALECKWRTHRVELPAPLIRSGINSLELLWPLGSWQADAAIEAAAAELEAGRLAELSPAFADIWSLWLEGDGPQ
jgi:hypothetical protein